MTHWNTLKYMNVLFKSGTKIYPPFPFIQWSESKIITHVMIKVAAVFSSMHHRRTPLTLPVFLYADCFLDYTSENAMVNWSINLVNPDVYDLQKLKRFRKDTLIQFLQLQTNSCKLPGSLSCSDYHNVVKADFGVVCVSFFALTSVILSTFLHFYMFWSQPSPRAPNAKTWTCSLTGFPPVNSASCVGRNARSSQRNLCQELNL